MSGNGLVVMGSGLNVFFQQYFDFTVMGDNCTYVLTGFKYTVYLSLVGGAFSLVWGLILAVLRQLPGRAMAPVRWLSIGYIDVFRGIPLLLVIFFVSGGIPFLTFLPRDIRIPEFLGLPDPYWYGVLALTITYGAYMAEVYRAGIEAVPHGQMEAARSLGMSHGQAMRYVIVPQAIRKVNSATPERLHRAHQGHIARWSDRSRRNHGSGPDGAGRHVQQLGAHPGGGGAPSC